MLGTLGLAFTSEMIDGVVAYVGEFFTDLNIVILLVIGLPLAFWVLKKILGLGRARA